MHNTTVPLVPYEIYMSDKHITPSQNPDSLPLGTTIKHACCTDSALQTQTGQHPGSLRICRLCLRSLVGKDSITPKERFHL